MAPKKILDAMLDAGLSSDDDDSGEEGQPDGDKEAPTSRQQDEQGEEQEEEKEGQDDDAAAGEEAQQASKRKKGAVTLEDLQRAGYKSGPSVLLMRAPQEAQQNNWDWSDGRATKQQEGEESLAERQATRQAANEGTDMTARLAVAAMAQAEALREARKAEKAELQEQARLSFNQKEKRKRDAGQQSKGKNYVEEEKRLARNFGVFSGFDT